MRFRRGNWRRMARRGDISLTLTHSAECWILNLEVPGSIPAWGELFIFVVWYPLITLWRLSADWTQARCTCITDWILARSCPHLMGSNKTDSISIYQRGRGTSTMSQFSPINQSLTRGLPHLNAKTLGKKLIIF